MGSSSSKIICEYDFMTAIMIRKLIQLCTCEMGSSIFTTISSLKFVSTTRASLPRMLSTEIKTEKSVSSAYGSDYCTCHYSFYEHYHCLKSVVNRVSVTEFDIDYGMSLSVA